MADTIIWNNWRDSLRDASFRGVPFKVLSHSANGGRRNYLHQFPFNDVPYLEDFGKMAGVYKVEAYVVANPGNGYNHFGERQALIEALEAEGPGTLVHPFLTTGRGNLTVGVQGPYDLKESFAEGGVARFSITFVEAGKAQQPAPSPPLPPDLDAAQDSLWTKFGKSLQTANQLAYVVDTALQDIQYYTNAIQYALLLPISLAGSVVSASMTTVATLRASVAAVMNAPASVAAVLRQAGDVFKSLTALVSGTKVTGLTVTDSALSLTTFNAGPGVISAGTSDGAVAAANRKIIIDTVRCSVLIEAVRCAAAIQYASYDDAIAMRDKIVNAFDYVMTGISQNSADDGLYQTMADLKQYAVSAMIGKGTNLPVLRTLVVPVDTIPSLVYAQMLYGDITREQEIIDRNRVVMRHPGFPMGGRELKVLSE